jgi:DNA repair protein RecO (recombination protein O)
MTTAKARENARPAFILHAYRYRETSLVVEAFTRSHGRVALVARGARRPGSALRGVLLAFQPLLVSWIGRAELKTLVAAEWEGPYTPLKGQALICGFYLSELILRLLARDDPHENLYTAYREALAALAAVDDHAAVLRRFELTLLGELATGAARPRRGGRRADRRGAQLCLRHRAWAGARGAAPHGNGRRIDGPDAARHASRRFR